MAIQLSITNVFRFISYITPVLLIFFMIMISVFNQDVKGLIYLGGVLIAIFIREQQHNTECNLYLSLYKLLINGFVISP